MELLLPLWLPILLSAGAVWIVSAVVWMVLPHHKGDFVGLADEDGFMEYIRRSGIKPGNYGFPDCHSRDAMKSEKVQNAWVGGPVGHLCVWKTPLTMGDKMAATFVVYLIVSALIAYLTRVALPGPPGAPGAPGAPGVPGAGGATFARVFQVAGTAGVLAYCFSFIPNAIWWGSYKRTIAANVVDGLVYGAVTGAIFAWLWPR